MSKYTTKVQHICESYLYLEKVSEFNDIEEILNETWDKVFNFPFPIFQESHRKELCVKILREYYTQEIAGETVGLWKHFLSKKLNKIMPYYNELYKSASFEYNIFNDTDYFITEDGHENSTTKNTTESTNTAWNYYQDTPQGTLENIQNLTYLTSANKDTNDSESAQNLNTNSANGFVRHVSGKIAPKSYPQIIKEYRQTIINIDEKIIEEMQDCFFSLW